MYIVYIQVHEPGIKRDIRIANPRICQTDLAGFTAGTRTTSILFHKYWPKNNINNKMINTVINEINAAIPGDALLSLEPPRNVSVREKGVVIPA